MLLDIARTAHEAFGNLFPGLNGQGKGKSTLKKSSKRDREYDADPLLRPAPGVAGPSNSKLFEYPSIIQQNSGESSPDSVFSQSDRTLPYNTADLSGFNNFASNSAFQPFSFSAAAPEVPFNEFMQPPSSFDLPFFNNTFGRPLFENSDGTPLFSPFGAWGSLNGEMLAQPNFDFNVPPLTQGSMYGQEYPQDQQRNGPMQQW